MDTSKEYIKQCEKAEEIQSRNQYRSRNLYLSSQPGTLIAIEKNGNYYSYVGKVQSWELIWLPRQDQLQEMIKVTSSDLEYSHVIMLGKVYRMVANMELTPTDSMEQLWLAFVMLTRYQKQWYNGEWRTLDDRDTDASEGAH